MFVVTDSCDKCVGYTGEFYPVCQEVCPVECFYDAGSQVVVHEDECIDCALCEPECPEWAIYAEDELPSEKQSALQFNIEKALISPWAPYG